MQHNVQASHAVHATPEEVEIEKLKKERDFWKDAWFEQRAATGRAYWNGFRFGLARSPFRETILRVDSELSDIQAKGYAGKPIMHLVRVCRGLIATQLKAEGR